MRPGLVNLFVLLFYAIATVFKFYLGGDMKYEMRRRKTEPTLLLTQATQSDSRPVPPTPYRHGMRGTDL